MSDSQSMTCLELTALSSPPQRSRSTQEVVGVQGMRGLGISALKVLSHIEFQSSWVRIFRTTNVQCLYCFKYIHDGVFYAWGVFFLPVEFLSKLQ